MITDEEVMRLFERADPARFDDGVRMADAARYLEVLRARRDDVTIVATEPGRAGPQRRRRWPIVFAVAAATVVAVVSALVFAARRDAADLHTPIAPPTTVSAPAPVEVTAEQVATAFFEAFSKYDVERAASYLARNADLAGLEGAVNGLRLSVRWSEASGFKLLPDTCVERATSRSGTVVRCTYDFHGIRSDEIGLGPFDGNYYDFTVQNGIIVSVSGHIAYLTNGFSRDVWEPFASWVKQSYPDEVTTMYTDSTTTMQRYTEESIRLWGERSREFAELRTSAAAYTARAEAICTAAQARYQAELDSTAVDVIETEQLPGENYLVTPDVMAIAAPIMDEALAELRAVEAPEQVRDRFESDYSLLEQENAWLRQQGAGVDAPTPANFPASHHVHASLQGCTAGG